MRLLVIRHARAAHIEGLLDSQRPLSDEGRREFTAAARWLVARGDVPRHIFHSPLQRTTETAQILAAEAGLPQVACQAASWLTLGTGLGEIAAMLRELPAELTAIIGHEPGMSNLVSNLAGGDWLNFRPGTIACLEFESVVGPGLGKLAWLVDADRV